MKLNYFTLGNTVPHLHTHVLPRYQDDPAREARSSGDRSPPKSRCPKTSFDRRPRLCAAVGQIHSRRITTRVTPTPAVGPPCLSHCGCLRRAATMR
jgi:hypothetical protein